MRYGKEAPDVEVEGVIETETAKAVLFKSYFGTTNDEGCWLPKSQIRSREKIPSGGERLVISDWIAGKNGLK